MKWLILIKTSFLLQITFLTLIKLRKFSFPTVRNLTFVCEQLKYILNLITVYLFIYRTCRVQHDP